MDEELKNQQIEQIESVEDITEIKTTETPYEKALTEEQVPEVIVEQEGMVVIDISEKMGWVGGESGWHNSLLGIDYPDQHPIEAISGLREELDEIESLKTVYSDKLNTANYYLWKDAAYDTSGYFVSIVDGDKIMLCNGNDVFGVTVESAGFVGNQNNIQRDTSYGLVVTSGLVDIRCESDVIAGDYVIPNLYGYAKKSESNYGYKVLAIANKGEIPHAVIMLGIQADVINRLGENVLGLDDRMKAAETNIVSAVNIANQAYNKVSEIDMSNKNMSDMVNDVLDVVDKVVSDVENFGEQVSSSAVVAVQAKAIAESAATSAASMRNEAVSAANDAATKIGELTKTLEPLTTWTDPETGNSGASYLANYIDNGVATKAEIETMEDDLEHATSAIQQNAKSLQSLVVSIDKYSVGEYSTAYGLTLDQATSILEEGIIYVPTSYHKETYSYVEGENTYEYEREFTPGYLYKWGLLNSGRYGWITIDKYYKDIYNINTSAPSVYFSGYEIAISENDNYGYWYVNSETIYDLNGNITNEYEPYTLYKWYENCWIAVATIKGNVNNRAISQIRQTANEIALEVTNARGSVASLTERITDTEADVQSLATWTKDADGNQYNLATIKQTADNAGADIALVVQEKDGEKVINSASIVAAINNGESSVGINADRIVMTGTTTFLKPEDVGDSGSTVISGSRITTGELDAEKVKVINLQSSNIIVTGSGGNQTVDDALADTLVSSTIYYALSTSKKRPPEDDAWQKEAPEKEARKYMWQKTVNVYGDGSSEESVVCIAGADGESAIVVDITSSSGTIYINGDIKTNLLAKVYQDNQDITDEFPDGAFLWEKYDIDGVKDTVWSYTGKTVAVSNLDIYKRAMFNCVLDIEQRIEMEDIE